MARSKSKSATKKAPNKQPQNKPRQIPRYHVVLWNDDLHTYDYVIAMMRKLFGHPTVKGKKIAKEVDTLGKAVCLTTTLEHAELKRDQIHAYGADPLIKDCRGAMWSTVEPAE